MTKTNSVIPVEKIERSIFLIRNQRVMVDRDLAFLYGVSTKALNQGVKRNQRRFPPDFMFRLSKEEKNELVTNCDRFETLKHSSALPSVFTEQGVAMLSSIALTHSDRENKRCPVPHLLRGNSPKSRYKRGNYRGLNLRSQFVTSNPRNSEVVIWENSGVMIPGAWMRLNSNRVPNEGSSKIFLGSNASERWIK